VPGLPQTTDSLAILARLDDDARTANLPPEDMAVLQQSALAKAQTITGPILAAALNAANGAPATPAGLATTTGAVRQLDSVLGLLVPETGYQAFHVGMQPALEKRRALVADAEVQRAFPAALAAAPLYGRPQQAVRSAALRFLDAAEFQGPGAIAVYAAAVQADLDRAKVAAVDLTDASGKSSPGEPSAMDMLVAVEADQDEQNARIAELFAGCGTGAASADPLQDMLCTFAQGTDGQDMNIDIISFEKLGCEPDGPDGYLCGFGMGLDSDMLNSVPMLGTLLNLKERNEGRFTQAAATWRYFPMN
jgi:hypothetical protein